MIYLDHAATTPVAPEVLEAMLPYFTEHFGNANSQHSFGRDGAAAVQTARAEVAAAINARPSEIFFTSGGTEADNWAIKGAAISLKEKGNHIITSKIEHSAINATCRQLEDFGFEVTYLDVDEDGMVSPKELEKAIRKDTILVSVMFANNEIGAIQPVKELAEVCRAHKILFHTDAVQAVGSEKVDVKDIGCDLLSLSGHKFYGPKGIGVLFVRNGVRLGKLITGGEQERSHRGGTSNVANIVGIGKAITLAVATREENTKKIKVLRDRFVKRVENEIEFVRYNGSRENRLCSNASFSFKYIEGESILYSLDLEGIAASSGSACSSGSLEPSRTLLAIGVPIGLAHGTIRFSFGKSNTEADVDYTVDKLKVIVTRLRNMSPLFKIVKEDEKHV